MNKAEQSYSGFIVAFEPARSKKISKLLEQGYGFRDSFSVDDWDLARKEIFFLTLNKRGKEIDAVALVQRAHGDGGTGKPKYGIDHAIQIDPPITAQEIADLLDLKTNASTPTRGRRIDESIWDKLVQKIKEIRPEITDQLEALLLLVDKEASLLGGNNRLDRIAEQRDALGSVMDIGGISRPEVLQKIDADKAEIANSILDLFDDLPIHERHLVEHDRAILEKIFDGGFRGAQFSSGVNHVRIYVADKTYLETALGTDLIIYQSLWESFIFVQYKLMSNNSKDENGWHYRPDDQFDKQANKINLLMANYPQYSPLVKWHFRLFDEPVYFKFCEKRRPTSRDDSLVKGMSMNWKSIGQFLGMDDSEGVHGGRTIGYKNCPRYLNNTEFSDLAKNGWIGSSGKGTEYIKNKIQEARISGREAIVAIIDVPKLSTAELRKASRKAKSATLKPTSTKTKKSK